LNLFGVVFAGILIVIFAFSVRIGFVWPDRYRGCDAYYHLLCIEQLRKRRRVPVVLPPHYLLENQEQWYPPGLAVFLSLLPEKMVKKYYWAISPAIDCLIVVLLYVLVYLKTGNLWLSALAGFLYAITPGVISETVSLTPRHLGSLFLAITMLGLFEAINSSNLYWLGASLIFGFMLLMTHKMSSQLLYFTLPVMSLVFWHPAYVLGVLSIIAVTFILSGGFFVKVLRGHYDILSFWSRHWRDLGAHQIYTSPVYGRQNRTDDRLRFHQSGIRDIYRKTRMLGSNAFILLLVFPLLFYPQLSLFDKQMLWWVILTYFLAGASLFIPQLRFLGDGPKYIKMAALPISYLAVTSLRYGWGVDLYIYLLLGISVALSAMAVSRGYRQEWRQAGRDASLFTKLTETLGFLKGVGRSTVICIPNSLSDMVAYYCRNRVVWGTHNYPFCKAEPFMPVWLKPLEYFVAEYGVTHILIDTSYVLPKDLSLSVDSKVFAAGCYELYEIEQNNSNAISGRDGVTVN
jgi:hypothetical protein